MADENGRGQEGNGADQQAGVEYCEHDVFYFPLCWHTNTLTYHMPAGNQKLAAM